MGIHVFIKMSLFLIGYLGFESTQTYAVTGHFFTRSEFKCRDAKHSCSYIKKQVSCSGSRCRTCINSRLSISLFIVHSTSGANFLVLWCYNTPPNSTQVHTCMSLQASNVKKFCFHSSSAFQSRLLLERLHSLLTILPSFLFQKYFPIC